MRWRDADPQSLNSILAASAEARGDTSRMTVKRRRIPKKPNDHHVWRSKHLPFEKINLFRGVSLEGLDE
tara:strand:+ start:173 stop:379 length:207 start_codon:yes stop_codon:yes gene_type:complete